MPRATPDGEKMEPLSIYVTSSLKARLAKVAAANSRSTSAEAARRIELSIDEEEAKAKRG